MRQLWPGVPLALGSAVLFGISTPLAKLLIGSISPWLLAGLLYLGAGAGLAIVHLGQRVGAVNPTEARLRRQDIPWLLAVVVIGGGVGPVLLMLGLALTSASSASLLLNLEGLATMAIAWVIFRENVDRRLLTGAACILAGAVLLSWSGSGVRGDWGGPLIAGASLAWGIDNNLSRKLSAADPVQVAIIKGLVAGSVNLGLGLLVGGATPIGPVIILSAVLLGFVSIGLSLVMFMLALRHLGAARTGAYYSVAPFVGAIVAVVLLREPFTMTAAIAGPLMGIGVWLHLTERHEHEHLHEALEHEHSHVHDAHHQHPHDGPVTEPHTHWHRHEATRHSHPHYPDLHHRHSH
jgi:drug/metabolite transporter (DMT)-like permease